MFEQNSELGKNFSYHKFIKDINVKQLIQHNRVFDESKGREIAKDATCTLCDQEILDRNSLRLSNGNYVCEACFKIIQTIKYPEFYQKQYEVFLLETEARRIAKNSFIESLPVTSIIREIAKSLETLVKSIQNIGLLLFYLIVGAIILLFFLDNKLKTFYVSSIITSPVAILYFILNTVKSKKSAHQKKAEDEQKVAITKWDFENPVPLKPVLKEFHDPTAQMTFRDKKILEVFDYWPGYPPYWEYIQALVLERDQGRCQISGCPSRTKIHIHHKLPISQGGSHRPENLVALCIFHHGLQPEAGHERVWGEVKTHYFNMVKAHYRNNSFVKAHVRRKELATQESLNTIVEHYQIGCQKCNHTPLEVVVDYEKNRIFVRCHFCYSEWVFDQKLPEESGPQMAQTLNVNINMGSWRVDFSLMENIRSPIYQKMDSASLAKKREKQKSRFEPNMPHLFCPKCAHPLKLRNGIHGKFWGCSNYPSCHYTKNYNERLNK